MSFCLSIFQKELYQLELADIIIFFSTEQEENAMLEFKTGSAALEDIYKEVSAFLNTNGGLLIIGSPSEKRKTDKKDHPKVCYGELIPSNLTSQDTLMRGIASNIAPSPMNIKAKTLDYKGGKVFVLEIPKSMHPPHQVSNEGKYYIRLERDAKPAPHGIVQALMNQKVPIVLRHHLSVDKSDHFAFLNPNTFDISLGVTNDSFFPAMGCEAYVAIAGNLREFRHERDGDNDFKTSLLGGGKFGLYNTFSNEKSLVPHIWWQRHFCIVFSGDYFYIQLILWARDTPAQGYLYKYHSTEGLSKYNLYEDTAEQREFYSWIRNEE